MYFPTPKSLGKTYNVLLPPHGPHTKIQPSSIFQGKRICSLVTRTHAPFGSQSTERPCSPPSRYALTHIMQLLVSPDTEEIIQANENQVFGSGR